MNMTGFDKIFEKSNMSEEKKKSKKLFGRMLINLRNSNHIKLYALMEGVVDTDMNGQVVTLVFGDKTSYDMVNNVKDKEEINKILDSIEGGLSCKLECNAESAFDEYQFEQFLKNEFGKLLTVTETKK